MSAGGGRFLVAGQHPAGRSRPDSPRRRYGSGSRPRSRDRPAVAGAPPDRGVRHDGRILERASSDLRVEAAGAPLKAVTSDWIERRPPEPKATGSNPVGRANSSGPFPQRRGLFLLGFRLVLPLEIAILHRVRGGQKPPQNTRSEHPKLAEKLAASRRSRSAPASAGWTVSVSMLPLTRAGLDLPVDWPRCG